MRERDSGYQESSAADSEAGDCCVAGGRISLHNRRITICKAFRGYSVGLIASEASPHAYYDVCSVTGQVAQITLLVYADDCRRIPAA